MDFFFAEKFQGLWHFETWNGKVFFLIKFGEVLEEE
jgi:hypothetical protein